MSSSLDEDDNVRYTTDPALARSIVEERGGYPGHAPRSEGQGDRRLLRIGFREDEDLEKISWNTFSEEFVEKGLAAVYTEDGSAVGENRPVVLREYDDLDTGSSIDGD